MKLLHVFFLSNAELKMNDCILVNSYSMSSSSFDRKEVLDFLPILGALAPLLGKRSNTTFLVKGLELLK